MTRILGYFIGWKGYAAIGLALFLVGNFTAWRVMSWREGAHQTKQAVATVRLVERQANINVSIGNIVVKGISIAYTDATRREREIPLHVTPEIDRLFPVPLGFVRVWNDAAHGQIPGPASGGDADPSGVPLSDVARAHSDDATTLDLCRTYLSGWWSWYDQQSKAPGASHQ